MMERSARFHINIKERDRLKCESSLDILFAQMKCIHIEQCYYRKTTVYKENIGEGKKKKKKTSSKVHKLL